MATSSKLPEPSLRLELLHPHATEKYFKYTAYNVYGTPEICFPVSVYSRDNARMIYPIVCSSPVPKSTLGLGNIPATFISSVLLRIDPEHSFSKQTKHEPEKAIPYFTSKLKAKLAPEVARDVASIASEFLNWHPNFTDKVNFQCQLTEEEAPNLFCLTITPRRVVRSSTREYYEKNIGLYIDPETMPRLIAGKLTELVPLPCREEIDPTVIAEFIEPVLRLFDKDACVEPIILDRPAPGCVLIHTRIPSLATGDVVKRALKKGFTYNLSYSPQFQSLPEKQLYFLTLTHPLRGRFDPYDLVLQFQRGITHHVESQKDLFLTPQPAEKKLHSLLSGVFESFNPETKIVLREGSNANKVNLEITTPLTSYAVVQTIRPCLKGALLSEAYPGGFAQTMQTVSLEKGRNIYHVSLTRSETKNQPFGVDNEKIRLWFILNRDQLKGTPKDLSLDQICSLVRLFDKEATIAPLCAPIENAPFAFFITSSLPQNRLQNILRVRRSFFSPFATDPSESYEQVEPVNQTREGQGEYVLICPNIKEPKSPATFQEIIEHVHAQTLNLLRLKQKLVPKFIIEPSSAFLFLENLLKEFDPAFELTGMPKAPTNNVRQFQTCISPAIVKQIIQTGLKSQFLDQTFPKGYECTVKAICFDEKTKLHTLEITLAQEEGVFDDTVEKLDKIRKFHLDHPDKVPTTLTAENVAVYLNEVFLTMGLKVGVHKNPIHKDSCDINLFLNTEIPHAELRAMVSILHSSLIAGCDQLDKHKNYSLEFVRTQRYKRFVDIQRSPSPTSEDLYEENTYNIYSLVISGGGVDAQQPQDDLVFLYPEVDEPDDGFLVVDCRAIHEDIPETMQDGLLVRATNAVLGTFSYLTSMLPATGDEREEV